MQKDLFIDFRLTTDNDSHYHDVCTSVNNENFLCSLTFLSFLLFLLIDWHIFLTLIHVVIIRESNHFRTGEQSEFSLFPHNKYQKEGHLL